MEWREITPLIHHPFSYNTEVEGTQALKVFSAHSQQQKTTSISNIEIVFAFVQCEFQHIRFDIDIQFQYINSGVSTRNLANETKHGKDQESHLFDCTWLDIEAIMLAVNVIITLTAFDRRFNSLNFFSLFVVRCCNMLVMLEHNFQ